ncbi:MAG TPA: protein kinase [Terriglobales bacterium]|nr:protein kinase [Terriglobales bacterium]
MSVPAPHRWHELSEYLDQALDLAPTERAPWLAALRESHPAVAEEVESLLADHEQAEQHNFLASSPPLPLLAAGARIGAYRLVKPIGEGGMGTVWLAERDDGRFQRPAAIKFLNVSLAARSRERFQREGSILARLAHPRIAQLLDAGVTPSGQPYLVLEYIEGEPIDQYCDRRALPIEARLRLFLDVLSAVSHAHANLIVHRDLKPSNVLVDGDGNVKLLDFGIAKLLDSDTAGDSTLTREAGAALTPQYASPEQLCGDVVTTATDVYALGLVLYVLLSGSHPLGVGTLSTADLVKRVVDSETPRLSDALSADDAPAKAAARASTADKLARTLRGDLEIIVAKALKKNRAERYASVAALSDDLARYLRRQPITARADSIAYRAARFIRRNRAATALAAVAFVASIAGVIGTALQARRAGAERDFALRELSRAAAIDDLNQFVLSDAAPSGKPFTVDELLARAEHLVARQKGDPRTRVDLLMSIGRQYTVQEEYTKARAILQNAYALAQSVPDVSTRAAASCGLAQVLANTGDMARAEALLQEGLALLPNTATYALDRYSCLTMGNDIARNRGEAQVALRRALDAQAALEQSPLHSDLLQADALISLAGAYRNVGRLEDSVLAFRRAAAQLAVLGRDNTARAATVYNNLGVTLIVLGRPLEAENALRHTLEISRDSDSDQGVSAQPLLNYGRALEDLDRLQEAADFVTRGLAVAHRSGNRVALDQGLIVQAAVLRKQGDLDAASRALRTAEPDILRLPPGHIARASLEAAQAGVARARGDLEGAFHLVDDAVRIAEAAAKRGDGPYFLQVYLIRRAEIEFELGRTADALADARRAVSQSPHLPSSFTGDAYMVIGRVSRQQGHAADALSAFHSAVANYQDALGPDNPSTALARKLAGNS